MSERLIAALERIAAALEPKQPMGFHEPRHSAKRVYIANEGEYLWYFWDGEKQLPIWEGEFTGKLLELSTQEKEFKGKTNSKLLLTFEGDGLYTFQTGLETVFARCILLSLVKLAQPRGSVLTLAPRRGEQNTVFCSVFCDGKRVEYDWDGEADPHVFLSLLTRMESPKKAVALSRQELFGLVSGEMKRLGWGSEEVCGYAARLVERAVDSARSLSDGELQMLVDAMKREVADGDW